MPRKFLPIVLALGLVAGTVGTTASLAAKPPPKCFGKRATIVGTNRDIFKTEELRGTPGNDVIVSLGGSDRIYGRGGDDLICGGSGDDYILAGTGHDRVKSQGHSDTAKGGPGNDRLWGGAGGADGLVGGPGNDRLFGGAGFEDSLIGGRGDDFLHGGSGYDRAEFWDSPNGIEADLRTGIATGDGEDTLVSIEGLVGSNLDDVLNGDDLSNELQGGDGDDVIRAFGSDGDGGMDILRTAGGHSILDGGEGPDIVSYNLNPWPVTVDLGAGTMTTSGFGADTLIDIEHINGSKENDVLIGDDGDNVILGSGGDDTMDGRGGIDEVSFVDSRMPVTADLSTGNAEAAWWGSDTFVNFENIAGSPWQDVLTGDDGPNLIWGGDRADSLFGLGGDDVLVGAWGHDDADGGPGMDACDAEVEINCETDMGTQ